MRETQAEYWLARNLPLPIRMRCRWQSRCRRRLNRGKPIVISLYDGSGLVSAYCYVKRRDDL